MSADNYYIIRRHPLGGFAAVMGFASSERTPEADSRETQYPTVDQALHAAMSEYSEYGVSVHQECDW